MNQKLKTQLSEIGIIKDYSRVKAIRMGKGIPQNRHEVVICPFNFPLTSLS